MSPQENIRQLVDGFTVALRMKLYKAEAKYGWNDAWMRPDWREELLDEIETHLNKGDPIDVAAFCAFAWHHGWSLKMPKDFFCRRHGIVPTPREGVCPRCEGALAMELVNQMEKNGMTIRPDQFNKIGWVLAGMQTCVILASMMVGIVIGAVW